MIRNSLPVLTIVALALYAVPASAEASGPSGHGPEGSQIRVKAKAAPAEAPEPSGYGDVESLFPKTPITIKVKDVEIRSVLGILAKKAQVPLVVSDGVSGKISLQLEAVPLLKVFELVVKEGGLAVERSGNSLIVFKKC